MNKIFIFVIALGFCSVANAACTGQVKIKELKPRTGGWVHIVAEGLDDIDVMNCGTNNYQGMLLNFNDTNGTKEGKQMMLSILLSAYMSGKSMELCSAGCDSQYSNYTRLDSINNMQ